MAKEVIKRDFYKFQVLTNESTGNIQVIAMSMSYPKNTTFESQGRTIYSGPSKEEAEEVILNYEGFLLGKGEHGFINVSNTNQDDKQEAPPSGGEIQEQG